MSIHNICLLFPRGRFGQVHKCAELSSGLTLAAKIIKVRVMRERVSEQQQAYSSLPPAPRHPHYLASYNILVASIYSQTGKPPAP